MPYYGIFDGLGGQVVANAMQQNNSIFGGGMNPLELALKYGPDIARAFSYNNAAKSQIQNNLAQAQLYNQKTLSQQMQNQGQNSLSSLVSGGNTDLPALIGQAINAGSTGEQIAQIVKYAQNQSGIQGATLTGNIALQSNPALQALAAQDPNAVSILAKASGGDLGKLDDNLSVAENIYARGIYANHLGSLEELDRTVRNGMNPYAVEVGKRSGKSEEQLRGEVLVRGIAEVEKDDPQTAAILKYQFAKGGIPGIQKYVDDMYRFAGDVEKNKADISKTDKLGNLYGRSGEFKEIQAKYQPALIESQIDENLGQGESARTQAKKNESDLNKPDMTRDIAEAKIKQKNNEILLQDLREEIKADKADPTMYKAIRAVDRGTATPQQKELVDRLRAKELRKEEIRKTLESGGTPTTKPQASVLPAIQKEMQKTRELLKGLKK